MATSTTRACSTTEKIIRRWKRSRKSSISVFLFKFLQSLIHIDFTKFILVNTWRSASTINSCALPYSLWSSSNRRYDSWIVIEFERIIMCCSVEEMEEPNSVALFETLCAKGVLVVKSKDERKKKFQQVRISLMKIRGALFLCRIFWIIWL